VKISRVKVSGSFIILFFIFCGLLRGGAIIVSFLGVPGYNQVTIKWTTENEVDLKGFEIQRSLDANEKGFKAIDFVNVSNEQKDKKEYKFEDRTVFKSSERTFHYRLKIVDNDDKFSYSKTISVVPTVSSARQTWGSIKAMFR